MYQHRPPVRPPVRRVLFVEAGGPTEYTQSVAGTLTTAGALLKSTSRALTGTVTTAGALAAIKTALLSLTATLTTAGTVVRQTGKVTAGALAPSGSLVKSIARALTGLLSVLSGALTGEVVVPVDVSRRTFLRASSAPRSSLRGSSASDTTLRGQV